MVVSKEIMKKISNKSRTVGLLLALFLGHFGAHRFYTGKPGSAVVMLILTLTFVGMIISVIWALVDACIIGFGNFKDQDGNPLEKW